MKVERASIFLQKDFGFSKPNTNIQWRKASIWPSTKEGWDEADAKARNDSARINKADEADAIPLSTTNPLTTAERNKMAAGTKDLKQLEVLLEPNRTLLLETKPGPHDPNAVQNSSPNAKLLIALPKEQLPKIRTNPAAKDPNIIIVTKPKSSKLLQLNKKSKNKIVKVKKSQFTKRALV